MCRGRGGSGGGKEDREGETVWKFVSPSCRAHFLFSWRSKMGAEGLAARPADASSEEGGGRLLLNPRPLGCLWPNPASFHRLVGSGPPGVREGRQTATPAIATPPAGNTLGRINLGQGHLAYKSSPWPRPMCQGRQSACIIGHFH